MYVRKCYEQMSKMETNKNLSKLHVCPYLHYLTKHYE